MRMPAAIALILVFCLTTAAPLAQSAEFYPVELVKPGQKGYGKTIFSGTKISTFDFEILGVLKNFGPKQDMILARLSGADLDETGVFAGMSGSPVYLKDRLLGAVAFSFPFSKEPIAGITPIGDMVSVFKSKPPRRQSAASVELDPQSFFSSPPDSDADLASMLVPDGLDWGARSQGDDLSPRLTPIATPLNFSGFSAASIDSLRAPLRQLGLVPVRGMGGSSAVAYNSQPLQAGSTISVQLVRGDMEVNASGTVTHISGDKVYAFGHPFLSLGSADMPMNQAAVVAVISSLQSSQKVSATLDFVGSIQQDRSTGIYGVRGAKPSMLPIQLKLETSRNDLRTYDYEIVQDSFLTPFMINLTVNNVILSSERSLGGQTLRVKCDIELKDHPNVVFESNISDLASTPALAALALSSPVSALLSSGFEDLDMERVDFEIRAVEETRQAQLVKVWQDKLELRPGEKLNLTLFLRKRNGETMVEKHSIKIPEGIAAGPLSIDIGDGVSLTRLGQEGPRSRFVPEDLSQLVKAINNLKKNDRLYIRLYRERSGAVIGGEGMPGLPPSVLALYRSRKTSGDVRSINRVTYLERELPATDYVLSGRKVIEVQVRN